MKITHNFVSSKANGIDNTLIQPSNWNDTHTITTSAAGIVVGQLAASVGGSAGAAVEIPFNLDGTGQVLLADPIIAAQAATKNYVDNTAFEMAAGVLPGQAGNAGKYLYTNGIAASWQPIPPAINAAAFIYANSNFGGF